MAASGSLRRGAALAFTTCIGLTAAGSAAAAALPLPGLDLGSTTQSLVTTATDTLASASGSLVDQPPTEPAATPTSAPAAPTTGPAASATSTASALGCPGQPKQVFAPWLDPAGYTIAPGGSFEGGAKGWRLSGGAKAVAGNEPFKVGSPGDGWALSLPAGSTATTPAFCVGLGSPTIRFFASGGSRGALAVDVIYKTVLGAQVSQALLLPVLPTKSWAPTLPLPLLANVTGLLSLDGTTTRVSLRFRPGTQSSWRIDDVYVDPWKIG